MVKPSFPKSAARLSTQYHPSLTSYEDSRERALKKKKKDKPVQPLPLYHMFYTSLKKTHNISNNNRMQTPIHILSEFWCYGKVL